MNLYKLVEIFYMCEINILKKGYLYFANIWIEFDSSNLI